MAIQNDFTVYPYSKVIRHTGANDNVYTVQAFYSWLMTLFDEPAYSSYPTPMKYNTPTSYTMLNGWFLDNGDGSNILQYLYGGSIETSGYTSDVLVLDMDTHSSDWVAGNLDKMVEDDGAANDVGPLLSFKMDYPTTDTSRIWVRDTTSHGTIANNSAITTDGGTARGLANGDSITGDEVYASVYTIASFAGTPNPQVYIKQKHPVTGLDVRIAEWSNTDIWDRGSIDVIIPVKLGGAAIDSGNMTIFVRQSGDTFTHTIATISTTGGTRTPIATETSADTVNITKGEHYLFYDGSTGDPSITVGTVIQNVSTTSLTPPSWYAEVVTSTYWGSNTGYLIIRSLRGSPVDGDSIYVGATDTTANVNGTVGDTYATYDAEATGPAAGDIGKVFEGSLSGAQRILRAYQDDGTAGKLLFQVVHAHATVDTVDFTGSNRDTLYKDFADNDVVTASGAGSMSVTLSAASTTLISGYSDVTITFISGTVTVSSLGDFIPGERITWNAGASSAFYVKDNGSNEMTLAGVQSGDEPDASDTFVGDISSETADCDSTMTDTNVENFEFPLQATGAEYSVFLEGGSIYNTGRSLSSIYAYLQYKCRDGETDVFYTSTGSVLEGIQGQFYIRADSDYAALKGSPFGSLAGTTFFGAQGVWLQGMQSSDANNIKLTDAAGSPQEPYISVTVSVGNTRVDDVIHVFLKHLTLSLPDKTQYTSHATDNTRGASVFKKNSGSFPNDTPSTGSVFVVDNETHEEHRYRYISWTGGILTLTPEVSGTAEGGTANQTLFDTGVFASGVVRGDIIRRTSDHAWCYVISVDNANQVTTTVLSNGTAWSVGNSFVVNSLVNSYDSSDTFFIPYLDEIEDTGTELSPGTATETLTYVSARTVLVTVRNVGGVTPIQAFVAPSAIGTTGMSVNVIRNTDEVYT
jgi:hypothetical protein